MCGVLDLLPTASGRCDVQKTPRVIFNKCPQRKWCLPQANFESGQILSVLQLGSSRDPPNRSNNESSLGRGGLQEFQPCSVLYGGCQAASFCHDCRLLVFKSTRKPWWMETGQAEVPQSLLFFSCQPFFSYKCSPVSSLWLISWVQSFLLQSVITFMEETIFKGPSPFSLPYSITVVLIFTLQIINDRFLFIYLQAIKVYFHVICLFNDFCPYFPLGFGIFSPQFLEFASCLLILSVCLFISLLFAL